MSNAPRKRRNDAASPGPQKFPSTDSDWRQTVNMAVGYGGSTSAKEVQTHKSKQSQLLQEKYENLQQKFHMAGLTQQFYYFLRKISSEPVIPPDVKRCPLMKSLCDTAKDLLLNELEIVVWAIYLDKYVWPNATEANFSELLLYSAFAAKTYMNEDITAFQQFIVRNKISNFNKVYNDWLTKYRQKMGIPPKELNSKYIYLSKALQVDENSSVTDYNFYVDEILHTSTQYNSTAVKDERYNDFVKILQSYRNKDQIIVDPGEDAYAVKEIEDEQKVPQMTFEDESALQGVMVRADSMFPMDLQSALPADDLTLSGMSASAMLDGSGQGQTLPFPPGLSRNASCASTGSARGLLISKPALEKMDSLITELQRNNGSDFMTSDLATQPCHGMTLRRTPSKTGAPLTEPELKHADSLFSSILDN